jgi:5-methylcytosine-specific restriction endonuclease McrA
VLTIKKVSECTERELQKYIVRYAKNSYKNHKKSRSFVGLEVQDFQKIINKLIYRGCPYCGCEFTIPDRNEENPTDVSVDIINPHFPTISDWNIWLLCKDCNLTKGHHSHEEFMQYCLDMVDVANKEILDFYKELGGR